jgi:hypothetical protein
MEKFVIKNMSIESAVRFYNTYAPKPLDASALDYVAYKTLDDHGILYHRMTLAKTGQFYDTMKEVIFVAPRSSRTIQDLITNTPGSCRIIKYMN